MLFHVAWTFTDNSEQGSQRGLQVFGAWQPPQGVNFIGFYGNCDGSGGVAIVETNDAAELARSMAPFQPWLSFTATPILPVEEAAGIAGEAIGFRQSIG
jgi:hypothetical protein